MELLVGCGLLIDCCSLAGIERSWFILALAHVLRNGKVRLVWGLSEVGAAVSRGGHCVGKLHQLTRPEVVDSIRRNGVADPTV